MKTRAAYFPPHTYIPGKTPRHPEGWFDAIRDTATPGLSEAELAKSQAFQAGLDYLAQGFNWEAHEVLEPVWMTCAEGSDTRQFVQGLIQLANARLKLRMDRPKAARRLYDIAARHFESIGRNYVLGQDVQRFLDMIASEKTAL